MINQSVESIAISGTNIFAGTKNKGVFLSTDNGNIWTQTVLNNQDVSSIVISGTNIFAGTREGVYLSTDNGNSWKQTGLNNQDVSSIAINGANIFAGTLQGVYLSTDNGNIWTRTQLKNQRVYSITINGTNIFASTLQGVHLSTDSGNSWEQTTLNNQLVLSVATSGTYIFAGTDGNSVFRAKISDLITNVDEQNNTESILNIYPNPIQNKTVISFQLEKPDFVSLQITNILGQVVGELITNKFMESGEHSFDFDASNLPAGMYFVSLSIGGEIIEVEKMIIE
jgi:hypothetical protein